VPLTTPIRG